MTGIALIVTLAFLTEALWELISKLLEPLLDMLESALPIEADKWGSALVGIFMCITANADLFVAFGIDLSVAYAGMIFTGLAVARGSNFIHDLIAGVQAVKEKKVDDLI